MSLPLRQLAKVMIAAASASLCFSCAAADRAPTEDSTAAIDTADSGPVPADTAQPDLSDTTVAFDTVPASCAAGDEPLLAAELSPLATGKGAIRAMAFWGRFGLAVGDGGLGLVKYGELPWAPVFAPTESDLTGLWSKDGTDVYVCGLGGTFLLFRDGRWQQDPALPAPPAEGKDLFAVWGSGDSLYVAGEAGLLLRLQDGLWRAEDCGAGADLTDLFSWTEDALFVATADGGVLEKVGESWLATPVFGGGTRINELGGLASGELLAAGDDGSLAVFTGGVWRARPSNDPLARNLAALVFADAPWLFGVDGVLLTLQAGKWSVFPIEGPTFSQASFHCAALAPGLPGQPAVARAAGEDLAMVRLEGSSWIDERLSPGPGVTALRIASVSGTVAALNAVGQVLLLSPAGRWSAVRSFQKLTALAAARGATGFWAAAEGGLLLRVGPDGAVDTANLPKTFAVQALCELGSGDLLLAGPGGVLGRYDPGGGSMSLLDSRSGAAISHCVCDETGESAVCLAGDRELLFVDGDDTSLLLAPDGLSLRALDGPSSKEFALVSAEGAVVVYQEGAFHEATRLPVALFSVSYDGSLLLAGGAGGLLLAFKDGAPVLSGCLERTIDVLAVTGLADGAVLAAGAGAGVFRLPPVSAR